MKKLFRNLFLLSLGLTPLIITGCGSNGKQDKGDQTPKTFIRLEEKNVELFEEQSYSIKASTNSDSIISYLSSNSNIASVNSSGKVLAKSAGSASIKVSVDDVFEYCQITVRPLSEKKFSGISFDESTLVMGLNEEHTKQINASLYEEGNVVSGATFTYQSEDETLVTVSESGMLTVLKSGITSITVTSGAVKASLYVDIYDIVIKTPTDWMNMLAHKEKLDSRFYLANDLDMTGIEYETSANSLTDKLFGELKGNYHTVSNITMKENKGQSFDQSIFGYATGFTLSNIRFVNTKFTSDYFNCGLFVCLYQHYTKKDGDKSENVVIPTSISNVLCDFTYTDIKSSVIAKNYYGGMIDKIYVNLTNSANKPFKAGTNYAISDQYLIWFGSNYTTDIFIHISDGTLTKGPREYYAGSQRPTLNTVHVSTSMIEINYLASLALDTNIWNIAPNVIPTFY